MGGPLVDIAVGVRARSNGHCIEYCGLPGSAGRARVSIVRTSEIDVDETMDETTM